MISEKELIRLNKEFNPIKDFYKNEFKSYEARDIEDSFFYCGTISSASAVLLGFIYIFDIKSELEQGIIYSFVITLMFMMLSFFSTFMLFEGMKKTYYEDFYCHRKKELSLVDILIEVIAAAVFKSILFAFSSAVFSSVVTYFLIKFEQFHLIEKVVVKEFLIYISIGLFFFSLIFGIYKLIYEVNKAENKMPKKSKSEAIKKRECECQNNAEKIFKNKMKTFYDLEIISIIIKKHHLHHLSCYFEAQKKYIIEKNGFKSYDEFRLNELKKNNKNQILNS